MIRFLALFRRARNGDPDSRLPPARYHAAYPLPRLLSRRAPGYLLLCLAVLLSQRAGAEERILQWDSRLVLQPDHSLHVTERLRIISEGIQIRHGIYRDIPLQRRGLLRDAMRKLRVLAVRRDGQTEGFRVEPRLDQLRIWIGSPDRRLEPGLHEWELQYRIAPVGITSGSRTHLQWDVTGTGWNWPIEQARATLAMPAQLPFKAIRIQGMVGRSPQHSRPVEAIPPTEQTPLATIVASGIAPGEGLILEASWPTAALPLFPDVATPLDVVDTFQRLARRLGVRPNSLLMTLFLGLFAVYTLFFGWRRLRNPWPRERTPLPQPPAISPACLRWLLERRSDDRVPVTALLDMALHGYLRIEKKEQGYLLKRTGKSHQHLPREEQALARLLFARTDCYQLPGQKGSDRLLSAIGALDRYLEKHCVKDYLRSNARVVLGGWLFCILAVIGLSMLGEEQDGFKYAIFGGMIILWSFVTVLMFTGIYRYKVHRQHGARKFWRMLFALFILAIFLPFQGLLGYAALEFPGTLSWAALSGMGALLAFLTGLWTTPTRAGMKMLRQIAAYRRYLLSMRDRPVDPGLLREHLPYVAAMEMEWIWNRSPVLAQADGHDAQQTLDWILDLPDKGLISAFTDDFRQNYRRHASSRRGSRSSSSSSSSSLFSSGGGGGGGSSGGGGGGW